MDKKKGSQTLKKNILVMLTAAAVIVAYAFLREIPRSVFVYGISFIIPFGVLILLFEDIYRKYTEERELLNIQYAIGCTIIIISVVAILFAIESKTNWEFWGGLSAAVFFAGFGGWFFHSPYTKSLQENTEKEESKIDRFETREIRRWYRARKKIFKAKTPDDAIKKINASLRYHLYGDTINGDINFDEPLAYFEGDVFTCDEMMANQGKPGAGDILTRSNDYINTLIGQMTFSS